MTELQSALLLRRQLAELNKNPVEGFSAGLIDDNDLYRWEVLIIGPPDTLYEGGVFKAHLTFPKDYPLRPPKMKFITEIWHPNGGFRQTTLSHCSPTFPAWNNTDLPYILVCKDYKLTKMAMSVYPFFMNLVKTNTAMRNLKNAGFLSILWKPS